MSKSQREALEKAPPGTWVTWWYSVGDYECATGRCTENDLATPAKLVRINRLSVTLTRDGKKTFRIPWASSPHIAEDYDGGYW